jgi:hypothetical protein
LVSGAGLGTVRDAGVGATVNFANLVRRGRDVETGVDLELVKCTEQEKKNASMVCELCSVTIRAPFYCTVKWYWDWAQPQIRSFQDLESFEMVSTTVQM